MNFEVSRIIPFRLRSAIDGVIVTIGKFHSLFQTRGKEGTDDIEPTGTRLY
jgi:hypothetical protein